ncbi:MAG: PAS domain S-box protein, partial [Desulfovibrio sp.]
MLGEELTLFKGIFQDANAGMILVEPLSRVIIQANRAAEELLGYGPGELNGMKTLDILHPEELEEAVERLDTALETKESRYEIERRYVSKTGGVVWVNLAVSILWDEQGKPWAAMAVLMDIAERKRAEAELIRSHNMLKAVIDHTPVGIMVGEAPDCKIVLVNTEAQRINLQSRDRQLSISLQDQEEITWEMFHADGSPWPVEEAPLPVAVTRGHTTRDEEMILRRSDGTEAVILCNAQPVRDATGEVSAGVVTFVDITERKEQEKRLLEQRDLLDGLFQNIPLGVTVWDQQGNLVHTNAGFETLTGYTAKE